MLYTSVRSILVDHKRQILINSVQRSRPTAREEAIGTRCASVYTNIIAPTGSGGNYCRVVDAGMRQYADFVARPVGESILVAWQAWQQRVGSP